MWILVDVGLGSCQLLGLKGEVPVATLEAVDHHGQGGASVGDVGQAGVALAADTGSPTLLRPSPSPTHHLDFNLLTSCYEAQLETSVVGSHLKPKLWH